MENKEQKYLIVLSGPTAVGKTNASFSLSEWANSPIISADSRQLYKEMNIGTAKPTPTQLTKHPHRLINHISIHEPYNAGKYMDDALSHISEFHSQQKFALLSGGTGLYIRAVCEGLDNFPEVDSDIKTALINEHKGEGLNKLLEELESKDPEYFRIVDRQNSRRVLRALSVIRSSGQKFSSFWKKGQSPKSFIPIYILLERDRDELYHRINKRVDVMMENGLLEEAKGLYKYRSLPSLQTVGYSELFDYFDGTHSLDRAVELIKQNSRRYAKRQMTWFRKNDFWNRFLADDINGILDFLNQIDKQ